MVSIPVQSEAHTEKWSAHTLESILFRYFVEKYYGLLLLPECHSDFYLGWINQIQAKLAYPEYRCMHHSLLANAASNLHFVDSKPRMQVVALTYYSNALRGLSKLLAQGSTSESDDGLLMSVMLLYLHGCVGLESTYADVPQHVAAMSRILSMRLFRSPKPAMNSFTKLALESVLNQIFLVSTGLWTDDVACQITFDSPFWFKAETLLVRCDPDSDQMSSASSPVLGIPVPLFRLAMTVKQFYQGVVRPSDSALSRLKGELERWEVLVRGPQRAHIWTRQVATNSNQRCFQDVAALMILVISLLLEQILRGSISSGFPSQADSDSWQIRTAMDILQRNQFEEKWPRCFIGSWPVYTLGFLMSDSFGLQLIKDDLDHRWHRTKFAQVQRYRKDLEFIFETSTTFVGEVHPVA